ncbi:MAG: septum formation initiator family protein [Tannerellaceae bacterium]|nr:septum formation initiator family protein [Tannerellaceae bacterium]
MVESIKGIYKKYFGGGGKKYFAWGGKYFGWVNVYWVVVIGFFLLTFIGGDCSLYHRYIYDRKIRRLEAEIAYYRKELEVNTKRLEGLRTDREGLERFAREEYRMKAPGEDLFIIRRK